MPFRMSFKGIGFKIFATIIAVVALIAGVWLTFFQSAGFEKTTATIVSITDDPDYIPDPDIVNDTQRIVTVTYTVDGKTYTTALGSDSPSYQVGGTVDIMYNPKDPATIHAGTNFIFGIYAMAVGGIILIAVIVLTVKKKKAVKELKENNDLTYAPSEKGEERELYFLTDVGTPKYGHRIEDKNRKVLYEAKMTKFTMANPYGFDFIDHVHNNTTPHLIGHEEETDWNNFLLLDNHYTFTIDGEDIWKHLNRNGITVQSKLNGKIAIAYTIFRNGEEIAYVETSSQYVHEDEAEEHKVMSKVPVQGFYRIHTKEKNLDLLFVTILAFARSGAVDDKGGTYGALFGTIKDKLK